MKKILNFILKLKFFFTPNYWISLSSSIDRNTILEGKNRIFSKANVQGSYIGFGSYVGINSFLPKTKMGKFCTIGPDVKMVRGKHPAHQFVSIHPAFYSNRKQAGFSYVHENRFEEFNETKYAIEVGNDVWIGANVIIIEGVKIGDGAIIGSGAVVSKDIEPYSINVGNPIKSIGYRFEENQIKNLLEIKWWDWKEEKIVDNIENFVDIKNIDKLK